MDLLAEIQKDDISVGLHRRFQASEVGRPLDQVPKERVVLV